MLTGGKLVDGGLPAVTRNVSMAALPGRPVWPSHVDSFTPAPSLMYRGAVLHIEWQTITWLLVSAILVYFVDGPNLISYCLAVIGVIAAVLKASLDQWQRWQLARTSKKHLTEHS
jgi:hypothetical protein